MKGDEWTHALCVSCFATERPDLPQPTDSLRGPAENCCKCGVFTRSGLYFRAPAASMPKCPQNDGRELVDA